MMKICAPGNIGCGLEKPLDEFGPDKQTKDGRKRYCKDCLHKYNQNYGTNYRNENAQQLQEYKKQFKKNNPEIVKKWKHDDYLRNQITHILRSCKSTAKTKNINFNLKKEDINIPSNCPIYGLELKQVEYYQNDNSISIDRIDNKIGYIKKNIIIVSWKANRFKRDSSFEEMTLMYKNYNKTNIGQKINYQLDYYKKILLKDVRKRVKRAAKKGIIIPFNITIHDFNFPTHCPILGLEIKRGIGQPIPNSPSIDRIDNTKGYVKDNIRIISYRANELKNNSSYKDYEVLYLFYKKLIKQRKKLVNQND
jgi:hypothetical protein